jgi:outer membrane cobalamin receptor
MIASRGGFFYIFGTFIAYMRILLTSIHRTALLAALILMPAAAAAQAQPRDSSAKAEVLPGPADSMRIPLVPIPLAGSIDRNLDSSRIIEGGALPFTEYRSLGDILSLLSGAFARDQASPGLSTGLTLRGETQQSIGVLTDGVPLNEPLTGVFNLALYPTEQIGRIEVIPAPRAFLYSGNASGGLVNLVYSESAHGYGFVDGSVSQDIIRGLNVTAGVQHTTFDLRFPNSAYNAWNARTKLRYNVSNSVNIYASGIYNGTELGLNGGISPSTPDSLAFEELRATVVNADAYEKITRYDIQAGVVARPAFDSAVVHTLTAYLSTQLREYRDEENRLSSNGITAAEDHRSQWFGLRWLQQRSIGRQSLDIGAEIASRAVIASPSTGSRRAADKSVFALATLRPADETALSVYGRLEEYLARTRASAGADVSIRPLPDVELFGGYSRSYRFPTFQEMFWSDSVVSGSGSAEPERHELIEAGLRFGDRRSLRLELSVFRRIVRDAVILRFDSSAAASYTYGTRPQETMSGLTLDVRARASWLTGELRVQYLPGSRDISTGLPDWHAQCGIYYFDKLVGGHLELKTGFRGTLTSGYMGGSFDERRLLFTGAPAAPIGPSGTLDFVLIAHIGDAYIHLLWDNLLGRQYVTTLFYPMPDRAVRFGVSWDFLN